MSEPSEPLGRRMHDAVHAAVEVAIDLAARDCAAEARASWTVPPAEPDEALAAQLTRETQDARSPYFD